MHLFTPPEPRCREQGKEGEGYEKRNSVVLLNKNRRDPRMGIRGSPPTQTWCQDLIYDWSRAQVTEEVHEGTYGGHVSCASQTSNKLRPYQRKIYI